MSDYISQIAGIVRQHLAGDYSDTLTRFSYLDQGAMQFISLTRNPDYTSFDREMRLLERVLLGGMSIIEDENLRIVDLGVGDGRKAVCILSGLAERACVEYLGLDISGEMIRIASLCTVPRTVNRSYHVCDFTDLTQLRTAVTSSDDTTTICMMLGNTITNEIDIMSYLSQLRNCLDAGCYLLVGLELLQDDIGSIVREYRNAENYALTVRPLQMIGMDLDSGIVDIGYNPEHQRIEEWFIFTQSGSLDAEGIRFHDGDRVLLSVTYKPMREQVIRTMRESGWREMQTITDVGETYILSLLSSR